MDRPQSQTDPYTTQKIFSASPEQLIAYIYDVAVKACLQEDQSLALQAVQELINALDYKYTDLANNFYDTYGFIQSEIRKHHFTSATSHLKDLRTTWKKAYHLR